MKPGEDLPACLGGARGWLAQTDGGGTLPALDDAEGERLSPDLPMVIDSHVHLFPDGFFEAIWRWFDQYGWPIRYRLRTPAVVDFLLSRGVRHLVALCYAHKPGVARLLNRYMAEVARDEPRIVPLGTVLPGEPDALDIVREAFALGLRGLKLHCHVQCFAPDDERLEPLYALCEREGRPLVMHAGREPSSPHYRCDTYALCAWERVDRVLRNFPRLKLVVPHLGADEFDGYEKLLERHDALWLDTTMAVADYFPVPTPVRLLSARPDRILYGTDFPNLPYAWDREIHMLCRLGLPPETLERILGANAQALFDLGSGPSERP